MKKYIISKLTQISAWIGVAIILSILFLPNAITICLALSLILSSDEKLQALMAGWSPKIKEALEQE